ncbi:MAG: sugar transferase [Chlorobi bacterium]|nr:sugar transferase [Chlorobiota bacterium]
MSMLIRFSALLLLILLSPLLLFISVLIILIDEPPVFFVQKRAGRNSFYFNMYKFRTMKSDAPNVATALLKDPDQYFSRTGKVLRKFGLDELPNLINILKGDMGFVGPRPVLYKEFDLIELRKKEGVDKLLPGLTGLAQINGRGDLSLEEKVKFELLYKEKKSLSFDTKILLKTFTHALFKKGVLH